MIIKNGNVFCPDGHFRKRDVYINESSNVIRDPGRQASEEIVDASGKYVIPGLVDVHTHGAAGSDFCDADEKSLAKIAEYEYSQGVTSFCPTSMTYPGDRLAKIFKTAGCVPDDKSHAFVAGINMEGPYISPQKVGAQNPEYVQDPDNEMFEMLMDVATAPISLVTLAPEIPGAKEFIERFNSRVHISLGHSSTDYETAMKAFDLGADHVTHLYNAMPPYRHREPGLIGAAEDAAAGLHKSGKDVYVELIADGIHSHPEAVRGAFRGFGEEHMVLISDSMRATGMPDGESELGGQKVIKEGPVAKLENGTIAGSVSSLMMCMKNAMEFGIPEEHAVRASTINPAMSIGMADRIGMIKPGARADILIMTKAWELEKIL